MANLTVVEPFGINSSNAYTFGSITATGNVTGNYILGNGALLTGVITSVANINSGNSNVTVVSSGGNVTVGVGGTSNVAVFATSGLFMTGNITPSANITYDLGTSTQRWKDLWLSNSTIYLGNAQISANATAVTITNPAGGTTVLAGAAGSSSLTGAVVSVTGNITGGNVNTAGVLLVNTSNAAQAITNGAANGVGNIGSSSTYFNTIFAKATSAQYADLAEAYAADADYEPGTVVVFGGTQEVTISTAHSDAAVAGVISTNPSYLMNSSLAADHRAIVALAGRVPTRVLGPVTKGAMMVSAGNGHAQACTTPAMGTVIGKSLENFDGESGMIEIVVGRV